MKTFQQVKKGDFLPVLNLDLMYLTMTEAKHISDRLIVTSHDYIVNLGDGQDSKYFDSQFVIFSCEEAAREFLLKITRESADILSKLYEKRARSN